MARPVTASCPARHNPGELGDEPCEQAVFNNIIIAKSQLFQTPLLLLERRSFNLTE